MVKKSIKRKEYNEYCILCDKFNIPKKQYDEKWHIEYHQIKSDMRKGITKNY